MRLRPRDNRGRRPVSLEPASNRFNHIFTYKHRHMVPCSATMLITNVCQFGREQVREREGFPSDQVVLRSDCRAASWQGASPDRQACSRLQRSWVVNALLLYCVLQFAACHRERQPSPDVMDEVHQVVQRIVSSQDTLQGAPAIARRDTSVQAHWQVQSQSTAQMYFGRVRQELGPEYHVISQSDSDLVLGKTLPGDAYTLEFKSKPSGSGSNIEVRFFALPN